jgi:hypothetical protein
MRPRAFIALSACLLGAGCTDLADFRTDPSEAYVGTVIGINDTAGCDGGICSAFRRGFTASTKLSMAFDPTQAQSTPGRISTVGQACGVEVFSDTPLLPIPALENDQLALYDFPGGGRIRNYMFALEPATGPLSGRGAVAFVSLLRDGHVEVRLLAGSGLTECEPTDCAAFAAGECDFFGVFRLKKEDVIP